MAIEALHNYIPDEGQLLWVIDEAGSIPPSLLMPYAARSTVLSNRFNIHSNFLSICNSVLSDFSLVENQKFSRVIFPVSKEKRLSNYVITSAAGWLHTDGKLVLLGRKNEGIKSYFSNLPSTSTLKKHADLYIGEASNLKTDEMALNDYKQIESIAEIGEFIIHSKPGIFSWKKIDDGSAFLVDTLKNKVNFNNEKVIDLGCGNGYLALNAALLGAKEVYASDNNITAVNICEQNLEQNGIQGKALADDCAKSIDIKFDSLLCNPPFHKGKNTHSNLTEQFVKAAKRLLKKDGQAWFVVNAFIPLEKIAKQYFNSVKTIANNKQFKVLVLQAGPAISVK